MREKSRWEKCVLSLLVCVVALCVCFTPALAQTGTTGALAGVVTDPSGAVIVGATVTATNIGTAAARTTTTNATGAYLFSLLPPGDYSVKFEAPGFQTSEVPSITVNVTESPVLNHAMTVGSQTQQVTVESTAETIQTENATVGGLVGGNTITALPLSTRNYTQIVNLSPGVVGNVASATLFGAGTQDVNVNGSSSEHNNYQMEGISVVNYMSGKVGQENLYGPTPVPNPDSIQEFKVQTSQFDATFGRNSGGNVNVLLKTGTNNFHGALWEFNRNNFFNANDFFNKITEKQTHVPNAPQTLKQNTFGATFGGPIMKDKLFFFGSYQDIRQVNGVAAQGYSPGVNLPNINDYADLGGLCADLRCTNNTAQYRKFLGGLYGGCLAPLTAACNVAGGPEAGGNLAGGKSNVILATNGSNINQVAINILQAPGPAGGYNQGFLFSGAPSSCAAPCLLNIEKPGFVTEAQYMGNLDYHMSDKNTISERFFTSWQPEAIPFAGGTESPGAGYTETFGGDLATLRLTSILSNNLVNEARVAYFRITATTTPHFKLNSCAAGIIPWIANAPSAATSCNDPGVSIPSGAAPALYIFPGITISGTAAAAAGTYPAGAFGVANYGHENTWLVIEQYPMGDQISWNHGKHSIRVGGDYERVQTQYQEPVKGTESFRTFQDFLWGGSTGTVSAMSAVGGSRTSPKGILAGVRANNIDVYAQDDIKLMSNLTVNIGVRYEYDGLPLATNTEYWTNMWPVLLNQVNSGSFFLNNPQGTLAGFVMPSWYPKKAKPSFGVVAPTGATGLYINSNASVVPNSAPKDVFSPRFGFAWQPKMINHLVVRGGYGWFHDHTPSTFLSKFAATSPPVASPFSATTLATRTMANPFPPSFQGVACPATAGVCPALGWLPRNLAAPITITGVIGQDLRQPLVQVYNLGIQYAIKGGWTASVGYIGSHGTQLSAFGDALNVDYLVAGAPNTPAGLFGERPLSSMPFNDVLNPVGNWVTTNQGPNASAVSTNQIDRVPFLGLGPGGSLSLTGTPKGSSLYNSLQASLNHQMSHGFSVNISYTYSKLITDLSGGVGTVGQAAAENGNSVEPGLGSGYVPNLAQQYGPAPFNRPQRLSVNYSYQLPFKSENGIMNRIVGGWALSGVTTVQNGLSLSLTDPAGGTLYGYTATGGTSRAEFTNPVKCNDSLHVCDSGVPLETSGRLENRYNCYFATAACSATPAIAVSGSEPLIGGTLTAKPGPFSAPVTVDGITSGCYGANPQYINCGTYFGNSRFGIAHGPSQLNFDMSMSKQIPVTEGTHLEFRAEAFNIWNHTQFNTPASTATNSANFGKIISTSVPPRIFQFALKYIF